MFNKLKTFSEKHIPENLKEKMKELGQTIAPSAGGGSSVSAGQPEKPELVPLRALQKVPPPNPEGTPEMVRRCPNDSKRSLCFRPRHSSPALSSRATPR